MRRAPIVLTATVLGTAGVLLFKPLPTTAVAGATAAASDNGSSAPSSLPGSPSAGGAASTGGTSSGTASSGTTSSSTTSSGTASSGTASSSTATSGTAAKDGTYTGDAETVRWGTTQVKATISGGRITDVAVVQENQNDSRSTQISESAFPTLRSAVLQQQTAAVDTVSGATYTSAQYEASLQSALDRAGFEAADGSTASTDVSTLQESGPGGGPGH